MPNLSSVLNEQIRRLARREIRSNTRVVRKATAHYRRDIAALKREVASLRKQVRFLERQENKRTGGLPIPKETDGLRFRRDGLKTHRGKLGISAKDYGQLVGVSGLTIYNWEAGKSKPRRQQLAKLAAVRGLGKREAMRRLEGTNGK
jgi:DNA-binding transcriptional regulator YiaG